MPAQPMYYVERAPGLELAPFVAAYWHFRAAVDAGEVQHSVPLTGGLLLSTSASRDGLILLGPRLTPLRPRVRAGDVFWGIHFWPGAGAALLGEGARGLRGRVAAAATRLDPAWAGALGRALAAVAGEAEAFACLDRFLFELLPQARPLDAAVMSAVFRILRSQGRERVGGLAEAAGLSPRQFRRRFQAAVELSAKELARLRRVRASATDVVRDPTDSWIAVAAAGGFADQAHLAREFTSLTGLSPGRFEQHSRRIAHGGLVGLPGE